MKKVFMSYSWDSEQHQNWVMAIAKELRESYGIDAIVDNFLDTNNVNRMMVEQIKDSDIIIVVVTKLYTEKADEFYAGVGFETELLLGKIRKKQNSVIVLRREDCEIPFYLSGKKYINFIGDYSVENMEELVRRINGIPTYNIPEVTKNPKIVKSKDIKKIHDFDEDLIPDLKEYNDDDLKKFRDKTYKEMINKINNLLQKVKENNSNFQYTQKTEFVKKNKYNSNFENNSKELIETNIYELYKNDKLVYCYYLWKDSIYNFGIYGNVIQYYRNTVFTKKHISSDESLIDVLNFNAYDFIVSFRIKGNRMEFDVPLNFNNDIIPKDGNEIAIIVYKKMMDHVTA